MKHLLIPLLCGLLCLSSCELFKLFSPKDKLPPETQTGANTFGCLVNGEVWIPKGREGLSSNLTLSYDPGYAGGAISLKTYRLLNNANDDREDIGIFAFYVASVGTYKISNLPPDVTIIIQRAGCGYYSTDEDVYCNGNLVITKLDLTQKIVSGRFEFTIAKENCDTLRITQGRFDMKLY